MERIGKSSKRLAAASTGVHTIWVSVVSGSDDTSDDNQNGDLSEAAVTGAIAEISAFWSEQSDGAVSFEFGGYETRDASAAVCSPDAIWDSQAREAFDERFDNGRWVGKSEHLLTLTMENAACENGAGFGSLGGDGGLIFSASGIGAANGLPALFHEFGHNLGLGHADAAICRTKSVDGRSSTFKNVPYSSAEVTSTKVACASEEYGDLLDIMGITFEGATPHASAYERLALGWGDALSLKSEAAPVTDSLTTLKSLNDASGTRILKVTDPRTGERYYVEFRTNAGRDATALEFSSKARPGSARVSTVYSGNYTTLFAAGNVNDGVVRILKAINKTDGPPESTVLAVTPWGDAGKARLLNLEKGATFTTFGGGTTIYVRSVAESGAVVKVTLQKYASTTTISMASKVKRSKAKATVTVKVIGGSKPVGTITAYNKGKKLKSYKISSGANGKITVTLPKLKKGKAKITFKYNGTSKIASDLSPVKTVRAK